MKSKSNSKTTRLALASTILLVTLGLAGCSGSKGDRAMAPGGGKPDSTDQSAPSTERHTDSDTPRDIGVPDSGAASQPQTGPSVPQPANAQPTKPMQARKPNGARPGSRLKLQPRLAPDPRKIGAAPTAGDIQRKGAPMATPRVSVVPEPKPIAAALPSGAPTASDSPAPRAAGEPLEAAAPAPEPTPTLAPRAAAAPAPAGNSSTRALTAAAEPAETAAPTAASPSTNAATATEPPKDYTLVKVFYGTDRKAVGGAEAHPLGKIPWGPLTAAVGGLTLLLVLVLCFARRSVPLRLATGLSILATIALGVCMIQIPRNTKPAEADSSLQYGNEHGTLQMGVCEVSIPKDHQLGELESPAILRLEFNEDPEKHVVLMNVRREQPDEFYNQLSRRIAQSQRREAFVFIHGYNVTFENAARRTAQLAHDLRFDGAPIFYSWPSQGGLLQYMADEENVVWTVPHLKEFLLGVAKKTNAQRVHLIAHSMGNRALTAALTQLSTESKDGQTRLFHQVLLTAPDINAEIFCRDIAPAIVRTADRVTLYASSHDAALQASKKIHGFPRAGESGDNIVVISGIDTIDVSAVDTSLVGHSYYGDSDTVLVDMAQLLHEGNPPDLRDRLRIAPGTLRYWVFLTERLGLRPSQPAP